LAQTIPTWNADARMRPAERRFWARTIRRKLTRACTSSDKRAESPAGDAGTLAMITYEIYLNGKVLTIAGAADLSVLSVTLAAVGALGKDRENARDHADGVEMDLHVGGLSVPRDDSDHVVSHWVEESPIQVGDEIVIRVKEAPAAHPSGRRLNLRELDAEREAFEGARTTYYRLRHKYQQDS
jgi:hypothetical protein